MLSSSLSSFSPFSYGFSFFSILYLLTITFCIPQLVHSHCKNPPIIFNFGDSNSDTGGLVAGLGIPVKLPNGRTFFGRSTGRLSDGRLVIDFLCTVAGFFPYRKSFSVIVFIIVLNLLLFCSIRM